MLSRRRRDRQARSSWTATSGRSYRVVTTSSSGQLARFVWRLSRPEVAPVLEPDDRLCVIGSPCSMMFVGKP
jgi:hypothetical protein